MRTLILGAGATGGYFGARLAQAGLDASFLLRPGRAAQLMRDGLRIQSPRGDAHVHPPCLTCETLPQALAQARFDLVILSCKAWDLDSAIEAIAPAMHADTRLLPILNGLRHYSALDARFGPERVLGGLCFIIATKAADGRILHLEPPASITFGERDGRNSAIVQAFAQACQRAGIDHKASPHIIQEQWIKLSYLATLAAATCLMRSGSGEIARSAGGPEFITALHEECLALARAAGHPIPEHACHIARMALLNPKAETKASMLRDLEAGAPVEADHIIGDLITRAQHAGIPVPLLQTAWIHLQCYSASQSRQP